MIKKFYIGKDDVTDIIPDHITKDTELEVLFGIHYEPEEKATINYPGSREFAEIEEVLEINELKSGVCYYSDKLSDWLIENIDVWKILEANN